MNRTKLLLLATVAGGVMMQPAMALDAQTFVDRVAEVYKSVGYDFEFGPATLDGDTVTVDGVTVSLIGAETTEVEPMSFDTEITFSGVVDNGDGSYSADSVTIPDIDTEFASEPVGHLTVSDLRIDSLYLPAGDTVPSQSVLQLIGAITTGPLAVTRNGEDFFSYESFEATSTFNPEQGTPDLTDVSSYFAINGIAADLTAIAEEDPQAGATIEALGLTTVNGDISQEFTWSMADGHMTMGEFLFDFPDLGSLNIKADITGLTPQVLDQLYAMQAAIAAQGDQPSEEQAQAQMMQGMALMQGVSIISASIRYDDVSLAGAALDTVAAQNGSDRATFVEGLKATLPALVGQSGIPALTDLVVPPVSAFLDDPQSLEIKVAPPSPTSLLVLMAAAANPAGLVSALGLAVEANTAAAE